MLVTNEQKGNVQVFNLLKLHHNLEKNAWINHIRLDQNLHQRETRLPLLNWIHRGPGVEVELNL